MSNLVLMPPDFKKRLAEYRTTIQDEYNSDLPFDELEQRLQQKRQALGLQEVDAKPIEEELRNLQLLNNAQKRLADHAAQIEQLNQRSLHLEAANQALHTRLDQLVVSLQLPAPEPDAPSQADEQASRLTALEQQVHEYQTTLARVKTQLTDFQESLQLALKQLSGPSSRNEELAGEIKRLKAEVEQIKRGKGKPSWFEPTN